MKKGLIMEGGAMRGMFTAGVIDVMMEHGIEFQGAVGVSAGVSAGELAAQPVRSRHTSRSARNRFIFIPRCRFFRIISQKWELAYEKYLGGA